MARTKALAKRKPEALLLREQGDYAQIQPLFNRIVAAVRRQGYVKSEGGSEACTYRNEDDTRCFVGHLIPDKAYTPEMEGSTVNMLHESGLAFGDLSYEALEFLEHMQSIHDDEPPARWEAAFAELAEDYDLDYSPPRNGRK